MASVRSLAEGRKVREDMALSTSSEVSSPGSPVPGEPEWGARGAPELRLASLPKLGSGLVKPRHGAW